MSDSAASSHPGGPPPPPPPAISDRQEIRASSTAASPELSQQTTNDAALASLSSAPVSALGVSPPSQSTASPPSIPSSISQASRSLPVSGPASITASASASGSQTATHAATATSPPTTAGDSRRGPAPVPTQPGPSNNGNGALNPTLPSRSSQLHIAEARAALVASVSNMLDSELQSRASLLHSNATALSRQERDVVKATEALRKENDKLAKVAKDTGRKIKELGNVQNWAEVLERDFLVLEETVRIVKHGGVEDKEGEDDSCSTCSGSSYWSGSESGGEDSGHKGEHGHVAVNVSLDNDILESLTEAMATELQMEPNLISSTKNLSSPGTLATVSDQLRPPAQGADDSLRREDIHLRDSVTSLMQATEQTVTEAAI